MVVAGPRPACCSPGNGLSPGICAGENFNAIAFVCIGKSSFAIDTIAALMTHEAAHTWGLVHVQNDQDVMRLAQGPTPAGFLDQCLNKNPGNYCEE
jgi:hypothetical protein